jgi:hypothetical protein
MSQWIRSIGMRAMRLYYWSRQGSGRYAVPVIGLLALVAVACLVWQWWGGSFVQRPEYLLAAEQLEVTPQPDWIHADVKAEVIRDGMLANTNMLDADVTVKVARAFELHAWVAHVRRVSKHYPGQVRVELDYRRPVAMVEVYAADKRWLLPVDDQGVLLPGEDFSRKQAQDYPRIATGNVAATGPVGTRWEDARIIAGVRIAVALRECWKPLHLYRIALRQSADLTPYQGGLEFELQTRGNRRITWGHAPGDEVPGEASASQKIAALVQHVQQHGPLDGDSNATDLDLRAGSARPIERTARRP